MNDILPSESQKWRNFERYIHDTLSGYGYEEIRLPVLEQTSLFERSIGSVTDIVEKEMYSFTDRNGESLTLRPEGTAGCVRAAIENGLLYNQIQRLWYQGPMFRHERPQKGRYRQFYQIGVEAFGMQGPDIDAEVILMTARFWKELGIQDVELQINSLGSSESRAIYREHLVRYFSQHKDVLDADSLRRLTTNPLRILDSKNPDLQDLIEAAPRLQDHWDAASKHHFEQLQAMLTEADLTYKLNPCLVRGLDYYCKTVFEWVTHKLGSQGTICAGGRYDGLVEHFGGKATPAVGFAMGIERIIALLDSSLPIPTQLTCYIMPLGNDEAVLALKIAEQLRDAFSQRLRIITHCGGGSFKSQFKRADKLHADIGLVIGNDELTSHSIGIKMLQEKSEQITVPQTQLVDFLVNLLEKSPNCNSVQET